MHYRNSKGILNYSLFSDCVKGNDQLKRCLKTAMMFDYYELTIHEKPTSRLQQYKITNLELK